MRTRRIYASLTVFFAMTMMMFMSMVFSVLEVLHVKLLYLQRDMVSAAAVESSFADYNRLLWDNYGILAIDSGYGLSSPQLALVESRMGEYASVAAQQPGKGVNLYRMAMEDCSISEFGLATDGYGTALIKEGARYARDHIPAQALDALKDEYDSLSDPDKENKTVDDYLEDAKKAGERADEIAAGTAVEEGPDGESVPVTPKSDPPANPPDNPVETIIKLKEQTILAQVLGTDAKISDKVLSVTDPPSERNLIRGNMDIGDVSVTDRLLFSDYAAQYLGNYRDPGKNPGLAYEQEYLVFGKDSDEGNLGEMAGKLLLAREAENLVYLAQSSAEKAEAESLAIAIMGWTGNAAIVKATELGIIAAWAYLESVLDVRLILAGGKVPAVKTQAEWTSRIELLPTYFDVNIRAKESENGLDYASYLAVFTALCSNKKLGLRFADILEDALHTCEDYAGVHCDNLIVSMKVKCTMTSEPIFFNLIPYDWGDPGTYHIVSERSMSYF